jgi:hypothetical protein
MKSRSLRARRALMPVLSVLANKAVAVRYSVGIFAVLLDVPDGDSWCLQPSGMCYRKPLHRVPFGRFLKEHETAL